jgi:hypothetical protein
MRTYRLRTSMGAAASAFVAAVAMMADSGGRRGMGFSDFTPLPASATCLPGGAGTFPNEQPFLLPSGFEQTVIAREGDGGAPDQWDMNTLNESGRNAGRFLYRTHETLTDGAVSVTDRSTAETRVLVQRVDWNRMDGIVWTPWQTLLAAEEMRPERLPSLPDPDNPQAKAGLVFEIDPETGAAVARPALGAKAHEGLRFDTRGNLYSISETAPGTIVGSPPRPAPGGYIFKFTPDRHGDLSSGQLYALKIVTSTGDRTGVAVWIPLDRENVRIDADAEATAKGATGYARPEDVETGTSTGNDTNPHENLYVAVTDESRVLRIELDEGQVGGQENGRVVFVSDYVRRGVNAPADFTNPDNLALDKAGNLFITEDTATPPGMDIWMAAASGSQSRTAPSTVRFATLTDCTAEPSGIYFDLTGKVLFANILHRAGQDLGVAITRVREDD